MAKAGGALPSWFWPAGVPRRAPVNQQSLARQFDRVFQQGGDSVALSSRTRSITYADLQSLLTEYAGGLAEAIASDSNVAICDTNPASAIALVVLAWAAGRVPLLLDPAEDPARLAELVKQGNCSHVLTEEDPGNAGDLPLLYRPSIQKPEKLFKPGRQKPLDAAFMVGDANGIVAHSHYAVTAMASGMWVYIPELKSMPFVACAPITAWETWVPVIGSLFAGTSVCFPGSLQEAVAATCDSGWTVLTPEQAADIAGGGSVPPAANAAKLVFVSCGPFEEKWRTRVERALKKPVLTIWGKAETGPLIAAHPSWVPVQSHGLPMVNVELFPIDADSGDVSIVPWEMLDRAEIGVELVAPALGYLSQDEGNEKRKKSRSKIFRTHQLGMMDNVGVVTLL